MRDELPNKWLEIINLALGGSLACAAIMFAGPPLAVWNAAIVGLLIMYCSGMALFRYAPWQELSNTALGFWAVVAPFLLGFGLEEAPMWSHVLIGISVATIAIIQLAIGRTRQSDASAGW